MISRYATREWEVCIHDRTVLRGMEDRIVSVGFVPQDPSFFLMKPIIVRRGVQNPVALSKVFPASYLSCV